MSNSSGFFFMSCFAAIGIVRASAARTAKRFGGESRNPEKPDGEAKRSRIAQKNKILKK